MHRFFCNGRRKPPQPVRLPYRAKSDPLSAVGKPTETTFLLRKSVSAITLSSNYYNAELEPALDNLLIYIAKCGYVFAGNMDESLEIESSAKALAQLAILLTFIADVQKEPFTKYLTDFLSSEQTHISFKYANLELGIDFIKLKILPSFDLSYVPTFSGEKNLLKPRAQFVKALTKLVHNLAQEGYRFAQSSQKRIDFDLLIQYTIIQGFVTTEQADAFKQALPKLLDKQWSLDVYQQLPAYKQLKQIDSVALSLAIDAYHQTGKVQFLKNSKSIPIPGSSFSSTSSHSEETSSSAEVISGWGSSCDEGSDLSSLFVAERAGWGSSFDEGSDSDSSFVAEISDRGSSFDEDSDSGSASLSMSVSPATRKQLGL